MLANLPLHLAHESACLNMSVCVYVHMCVRAGVCIVARDQPGMLFFRCSALWFCFVLFCLVLLFTWLVFSQKIQSVSTFVIYLSARLSYVGTGDRFQSLFLSYKHFAVLGICAVLHFHS